MERRTQLHQDGHCYFIEAKDDYDNLIEQQHKHNTMVMDYLTTLNDRLVERMEELDEKTLGIQDQNDIRLNALVAGYDRSKETDDKHETQFNRIFQSIGVLEESVSEQKTDLKDLRKHLDNGYADKLIDRLKEQTEDITDKSADKITERMLDMFEIMVQGKVQGKLKGQAFFWTWLIRLTAAGGLAYIVIDKLF